MPRLRTFDLFTGIGGVTHALRGIAVPLLYCDNDPKCLEVLDSLMKRRLVPNARVVTDVSHVVEAAKKLRLRPDMVVAGFPCQGFSNRGLREGLLHEGSGLFGQLVKIVDACQPPLVFMENVAAIASFDADFSKVLRAFTRRGYALRWAIVSASDVGAPQERRRWFCLASLPTVWERSIAVPFVEPFVWSRATEPRPRMQKPESPGDHVSRFHMLGNSVCPDAVRLAFLHIWSGGDITELPTARIWSLPLRAYLPPEDFRSVSHPQNHGYAFGLRRPKLLAPRYPAKTIVHRRNHYRGITLDPRLYKEKASSELSSPRVRKPVEIPQWATPRTGASMNRVLTRRAIGDLQSQVRFATTTTGVRSTRANIEWVEWLMGYPAGWTSAGGS
jgi:site-specific DNA-cytosine methylase